MKKHIIVDRRVTYDTNSSINHVETDGNNPDYIYIQHKHADYQIRLITKGVGVCMIGGYLVEYKKGDILLVGSNVPHCTTLFGYPYDEDLRSKSMVLQFHPDLFPKFSAHLPEFVHINGLLAKSQSGMLFNDLKLADKVHDALTALKKADGIDRICILLKMLEMLARNEHYKLVSEEQFDPENTLCNTQDTMQKVYEFLYVHMKEEIKLNDIADHVGLTPAALCRAFRNKTRTTIFQFLNKIRVENVCKLLIYSDMTISQAAYESGFNSMPYFNRQFKKRTNMSPSEYKGKLGE